MSERVTLRVWSCGHIESPEVRAAHSCPLNTCSGSVRQAVIPGEGQVVVVLDREEAHDIAWNQVTAAGEWTVQRMRGLDKLRAAEEAQG